MNTNLFLWLLILTLPEIVFSQSNFKNKDGYLETQLSGLKPTPNPPHQNLILLLPMSSSFIW